MQLTILGSGGGMPSGIRETACTLVREGERALLLDSGTGARRLVTDPAHLEGVEHLDVVLTHFHLDHVCGLPYLPMLPDSAAILEPLRRPPIAPTDFTAVYPVEELGAGDQVVGGFAVRASAQPRHWSPSAGLRIGNELALVTDTPYEESSAALAEGVRFLLHEAWSSSSAPMYPEHDATAADAARVAREAGAAELVLIHLNPRFPEHSGVLEDAAATFERVRLGEDAMVLAG
jgi:ribonuclease BN (tRNA processing enzyme)